VINRAGLEAASCECYGTVRRGFERLLPHTYENNTRADLRRPRQCS
jgi:hypothetical protein